MSKVVPLEGFRGGSSPLNFKIVAYATEEELIAAQPRKNTIGIVTTTPITGYRFSATEPEGMIDGKVWISTGTNSNSAFDIVNDVTIYPISAKQYVSGAWTDVTAKSYQGGEWVDWIYYITKDSAFYNGHELVTEINKGGTLTIEDGVGIRYKSPTKSTYIYTNYGELDTSKLKTITMTVKANTSFSKATTERYNAVCAMFLSLPSDSEVWEVPQTRLKTAVAGSEYELSIDLSGLNDVRLVKVYANDCDNVDFTVKSIIAE